MSIFLATTANFDMYHLDLNGVFQGASLTLSETDTIHLTPGVGIFVGGTNHLIQGHAITPGIHVQLDVATAQTFDLYGNSLVSDPQGNFSAGQLIWLNGAGNLGEPSFSVMGFSLSAVAFSAAVATTSQADDFAHFRKIFSGNDYVEGSEAMMSLHVERGRTIIWTWAGGTGFLAARAATI